MFDLALCCIKIYSKTFYGVSFCDPFQKKLRSMMGSLITILALDEAKQHEIDHEEKIIEVYHKIYKYSDSRIY